MYGPLPRLVRRVICSLDACICAVTHPVKKVAQWRVRGIDVHAEEPLQCQERLGLDITPRGKKEEMFLFHSVVRWFQEGEMKFHLCLNEYLNVFSNAV